jgi:aldehyde:ferredoxin oxidoreductase
MAELGLANPQPGQVLNAEKVRYAFYTQCLYSCLDSVNMCQFVFGPSWHLYGPSHVVDAVRAVTGWNVSLWELVKVGERRLNLMRAFNAREGLGREADRLPKKLSQALVGGESDGVFVTEDEVEKAKDTYYAMAGWDVSTGTPTRAKLEELGLAWVADELEIGR